ncbi:MAG: zinc-binding alcohol dehydrogenase family protein [Verrucomicrobiales bacterium]
MKSIQFTGPREARLVDIEPDSSPGPGEALVRTHRMGICGTDISAFLGRFPFFEFPRIPGHELGVEVVGVADDVTGVKAGDRCSVEPYFNNPESTTSQRGLTNCCPQLQVLGVHCDGGLRNASYLVPACKLHVGNSLSYEELALVEPLAIGYHAVERGAPAAGETVLVIGAGPIGLACLEFLKLHNIRIVVMDLSQSRLDFCRDQLGIEHTILARPDGGQLTELVSISGGELADLVIDATGSARSMSTCFEFAGFGGRVVYVGVASEDLQFPHAPTFHRRELSLLASRNARSPDFEGIIQILTAGKIDLAPWMTHRLGIGEVPDQFATVTHPDAGAIKAIIDTTTL